MLYLYDGGGAEITRVYGPALSSEEWNRIRGLTIRLLESRGKQKATTVLTEYPFELLNATNFFGDEFAALRLVASAEQYVALNELKNDSKANEPFRVIAKTISEIGPRVRFVVVQVESEDSSLLVPPPSPKITSESVESALADAELLLRTRGAANALDRVHTALHGYLRAALQRGGGQPSATATVTELYKELRQQRPELRDSGPRAEEVKRITMALATIVDSTNTLRNTASAAHPTGTLLDSPEAMLAINVAHSLIHYLDARLD